MNKHLSSLISGYQDLRDRYGHDDPLVRRMKEEIEQRRMHQQPPAPARQASQSAPADGRRRPQSEQQLS